VDRAVADTGDPSPAAVAARDQPLVSGTPCSVTARSCVDLDSQRAWLIQDGKAVRGPVKISSGGAGKETPVGHSFRVYRKDKDYASNEFRLADGRPAPMPWSVFFADGGIAFHAGNRLGPGRIHLPRPTRRRGSRFLQVGDQCSRSVREHAADTTSNAASAGLTLRRAGIGRAAPRPRARRCRDRGIAHLRLADVIRIGLGRRWTRTRPAVARWAARRLLRSRRRPGHRRPDEDSMRGQPHPA
jgi:hypothetical protein